MSDSPVPPEWSEDDSRSWSHSRLPVELRLIPIGGEWDVEVTPLPDQMSWHSTQVNIREDGEAQEREIALSYMKEFNDIEFDVREEYPEFSEERIILIAANEAILNLR